MLRSAFHLLMALAFAAAIVPRGWLHHCDQEHVDHHHPGHAALYADLDCEVCSTIVAVFDGRTWRYDAGPLVSMRSDRMVPAPAPVGRWMEEAASRGPPQA